ncbi:hypothetical protein B0H17DRAFT_1200689 [Mycena rosella]|uniref:Uncharacterized protein n=1 Tax=Mycena rosella TaxID=1033263 RepID=A0AAD7DIM6_MYCRO|nr:hypothetical protein B0H17DRAFT_1200689 [Mycena rosella]
MDHRKRSTLYDLISECVLEDTRVALSDGETEAILVRLVGHELLQDQAKKHVVCWQAEKIRSAAVTQAKNRRTQHRWVVWMHR